MQRHNEVTGFIRTAKGNVQLAAIFVNNPARDVLFLATQIVVIGFVISSCLAATGIITNFDCGKRSPDLSV